MEKLSAWLAIAVGVLIASAQLVRNFDNWANWPTWMIDEAAAAVMIIAGILALWKRTTRLLLVGWAFACGVYGAAMITHMNSLPLVSAQIYDAERQLLIVIGGLLAVSAAGLALALFARRTS